MNPIRKAINERNKTYLAETQKLIALFIDKLNKAVQYFIKIDRDIEWKSVEFIPGSETFIYVVGFVEIKLGDIISINDKKIVIDENYLSTNPNITPIRIMISIEDLNAMAPHELYGKIKEFYDLASFMSHEQIAAAVATLKITNLHDLLEKNITEFNNALTDVEPRNVEELSFDLSSLSDDQRQQLRYHLDKMKTKN